MTNDRIINGITTTDNSEIATIIDKYVVAQSPIYTERFREDPPMDNGLVNYSMTQKEIDNIENFIAMKTEILWTIAACLSAASFNPLLSVVFIIKYGIYGDRYSYLKKAIKKATKIQTKNNRKLQST